VQTSTQLVPLSLPCTCSVCQHLWVPISTTCPCSIACSYPPLGTRGLASASAQQAHCPATPQGTQQQREPPPHPAPTVPQPSPPPPTRTAHRAAAICGQRAVHAEQYDLMARAASNTRARAPHALVPSPRARPILRALPRPSSSRGVLRPSALSAPPLSHRPSLQRLTHRRHPSTTATHLRRPSSSRGRIRRGRPARTRHRHRPHRPDRRPSASREQRSR
jgi:hypothetical protein